MVRCSNGSTRRILTFPAVHPCKSIAPVTLLNSVISLAHSIQSYKSKFFPANRRNAREIIREIEVLLVILEEIRVDPEALPDSAVLGLSELHLTFQKVRYLLEDCSREGARVWMLVKSERVANQFRVLGRAVATALDVLPRSSIGVSGEAQEAIELVLRQARKTRFEIDPADRRVLEEVSTIFELFENRIVPDLSDLRRVLDFVGIQSWSDCNNEIRFLDSEIALEWSAEEKSESSLLSSLMGFVTFCRCVLFDVAGGEAGRQSADRERTGDSEFLNYLKPDDFRCPISLEFMTDPVTISTGHTYDRSSILKWFRAGNPICPKTGERLKSLDLVPNLALRSLIQLYCSENNIPNQITEMARRNHDVTRTVVAGSPAADGAMKMVAKFISSRLESGTGEERNRAAYEVRVLAKASVFNRSCLVESNTIPHLLNLLSSPDSSAQENAIAALLNLSKHSKSRAVVINNGGLKPIVHVLQNGLKTEARHHAAATLFYLASIKEYAKLIGETPEAIPGLVSLIKSESDRGKKNSLVALFGLLAHPLNHFYVLASGAVPLLATVLTSSEKEDLIRDCLAVLARLAEKPAGTAAVLRHGALDRTMELLSSATSKSAKEHCVSILLAVCVNGGADVVGLLVKSSSLMGSLYSLLSEGTPRASRKATALIRVLHEYFERRSSGAIARSLPRQEQAVHVW